LLERRELLLDAHRGAFLELQPVEQAVPLVVDLPQFLLEFRAVAEQLEQSLILGMGVASREAVCQPPQAVRNSHAASRSARP
jgi:hypothetical protein